MPEPYAKYLVTAKHPHQDHVLTDHPVTVYREASGWWCDSPGLGCSKTYDLTEPVDAIARFVGEHGCYQARCRRVD